MDVKSEIVTKFPKLSSQYIRTLLYFWTIFLDHFSYLSNITNFMHFFSSIGFLLKRYQVIIIFLGVESQLQNAFLVSFIFFVVLDKSDIPLTEKFFSLVSIRQFKKISTVKNWSFNEKLKIFFCMSFSQVTIIKILHQIILPISTQ